MNLLESAGFSRSNPYYIVRQGQINQMAIASDSQRLKLLQEIAGTRVYDDKREESKCLLKEIEGKLEKSQEFLRIIEEHLKTLEEEKDELKIYQQWDKQRRCLEYTIHERKLKENKKKLEELERVSVNSRFEQGRLFAEAKAAQEMVRVATKRLKEAKKEVQSANEERDALSAEQQQLLKEKTKLTFTINDLLEEVKGDNDSKERTQQELKELEANIAAREEELEKLKPEYEEMKRVENELTRELQLKEQKRKELYAKQGRGSQFASKDERDKWIRTELEQLAKQIKDKEEHEKRISEDMKRDAEELVVLENKIEEHMREMEQQRTSIDERMNQNYELTKAKDQWLVIRKEQYRQENVSQLNLSGLKEDLAKADQNLRSMAGKAIMNGRDSVRKVLDTLRQREDMAHKVRSYYGPVIENFSCEKSLYTAVEVIAGNRLFHHIVETDTFGTKILKEMNKQRLPGEVTFVPLNRLRVKDIKYPETSDAIPMISKLQYDQKYARAMRFIFEKTLICRNLEAATNLARMSGLDCVTLEGDRVSSKGFMTGGYFDTSRSRLKIQKTRSELIAQIESLESQLSTLKEEIRKSDQNIISYVSEMQKTETRISKAKNIFDKMNADLRLMKEELSTIKRYRTSKEQSLMQCTSSLKALRATQEGFESELHEELTSELSVADQQQVDFLNDDIRRLTKDNKDAFVKRMRLEAEKNKLENFLTNNLIRKKNELVQALQEISVEDRQHKLESSKAQLADVEKVLVRVNSDFEAQNERVTNAIKKQKSESVEVEKWKLKQKEVQEKIDANGKDVEKLASKLNILQQKIVECTQRITELGALPSHEMYVKFCEMTTKQLFKEMEKVNDYLKKYSKSLYGILVM
ncbi:structural maintenance of chromosomes protein 3-like isoform X2 [Ceratina calcarata]|uniref:Structural maintenance of chromosomes protein 3-like isoform X2 n=1 Tax=Ceratina calcarata TaxID=156304 RepID=A0AAJ7SE71_9HYME|nr:structural maintenance of chromosomes protein 3-like isoform X2 [Ceratina calcarata]